MKKLSIITIIAITVIIASTVLGSRAFAQQRLFHLWGEVKYDGAGGVGSGKPVHVYFQNPPIKVDSALVYTDGDSHYSYSFNSGTYFWKVSCRFQVGDTWYSGVTWINSALYADTQVDITVYEE